MSVIVVTSESQAKIRTNISAAECVDGISENTNQTYKVNVPAGVTVVIPDITITKQDGSTVQEVAAIDLDLRIIDPMRIPYPVALSDENTEITDTGVKVTFRTPFACTLDDVRLGLNVAVATADFTMDLKENNVSVFSTLLTIDIGQKTSVGATIPPVISDPNLADDSELTADITITGTLATGAKIILYLIES